MLNWNQLTNLSQFELLVDNSNTQPFAVFKHSTRCSVSSMAKKKIEFEWKFDASSLPIYYLDLIQHRDISNKIASELHVEHQSPQLIVVKNKQAVYHESHGSIEVADIHI